LRRNIRDLCLWRLVYQSIGMIGFSPDQLSRPPF
jgi:hypothetical protein